MEIDSLILMFLSWAIALGLLGFCVFMLRKHPSSANFTGDDSSEE